MINESELHQLSQQKEQLLHNLNVASWNMQKARQDYNIIFDQLVEFNRILFEKASQPVEQEKPQEIFEGEINEPKT